MSIDKQPHVFEDRVEAGRRLARLLPAARSPQTILLGIARGGVPVAASAADRLLLPWNVIVARRMPIPWHSQSGFGAVAADGSTVINEAILDGVGMTPDRVEEVLLSAEQSARHQAEIYAAYRPRAELLDQHVILIDDVIISGYTTMAALKSIRAQGASRITVAAPVVSRHAARLIEVVADECAFEIISHSVPFSTLDFYLQYHTLRDEDVIPLLLSKSAVQQQEP